jgi:hypothetical protein
MDVLSKWCLNWLFKNLRPPRVKNQKEGECLAGFPDAIPPSASEIVNASRIEADGGFLIA